MCSWTEPAAPYLYQSRWWVEASMRRRAQLRLPLGVPFCSAHIGPNPLDLILSVTSLSASAFFRWSWIGLFQRPADIYILWYRQNHSDYKRDLRYLPKQLHQSLIGELIAVTTSGGNPLLLFKPVAIHYFLPDISAWWLCFDSAPAR